MSKTSRNPNWNRDELILALDLYMKNRMSPPGPESTSVRDLSALLNKMHRIEGTTAAATLRNENGVSLKLMNYRALDPDYLAQGKVGMKSGGKLEKHIWTEYADYSDQLRADANAIRDIIENADEAKIRVLPQAEEYVGEEGGVTMRLHKRYERDQKLVRDKRTQAINAGNLKCEVCQFDFEEAYGDLGSGYIEVHHLKPVNQLGKGGKTKMSDLALLCANCHRMAHRKRIPLSIEEIASQWTGDTSN